MNVHYTSKKFKLFEPEVALDNKLTYLRNVLEAFPLVGVSKLSVRASFKPSSLTMAAPVSTLDDRKHSLRFTIS